MNSQAASARAQIATLETTVESLRRQIERIPKELHQRLFFVWHLRWELRTYGSLLGNAKDQLAIALGSDFTQRDAARTRYFAEFDTEHRAWEGAQSLGNPMEDATLSQQADITDAALLAWIEAPGAEE